jgi:DJ-1/PfpI family
MYIFHFSFHVNYEKYNISPNTTDWHLSLLFSYNHWLARRFPDRVFIFWAGLAAFSVCTGALICGAAGLLKGRRATTHWASFHLLPYFGAIPVNERVMVDREMVFAAGVTAGIDRCRVAWWRGRPDHPALHGVRAGTALQQRDAGDRTGRHSRTGQGFR